MKLIVSSARNFLRHQDTDLAAGLTYYAVLAIFPAALALLSLMGFLGNPDETSRTVIDVLRPLLSVDQLQSITPTIHQLSKASGATWTFAAGTAGALWSASAYVSAFSRAMNTVREIEETRPFWKLRPTMLLITVVAVVLNILALVMITVSGPLARSVGDKLGVGRSAVRLWDQAKWPVLVLLVVVVVALLIHATPNTTSRRFRFLSPGAFTALLIWGAASVGFGYYVTNFGSYNKTYGSVAGGVIALVWLWLTNAALLFGAELDAARDARTQERATTPADAAGAADGAVHPPRSEPVESRRGSAPVYGPATQPVPEED
jgi:membrane protein